MSVKKLKSNLKPKGSKKSKASTSKKELNKKPKVAGPKKLSTPKKPYTKSELLQVLAEQSGLAKQQINSLLDSIGSIIEVHLKSGGPGTFTLPGLFKIVVVKKPATKARPGINPFTKEEIIFKAKPARKVTKIKALKKLKAMV